MEIWLLTNALALRGNFMGTLATPPNYYDTKKTIHGSNLHHKYPHNQDSKTMIITEISKADGVRNIKLAPKKNKLGSAAKLSTKATEGKTLEGIAAVVVKRGRPKTKTATPSQTSRSASRPHKVNKDCYWCTKFGQTFTHEHVAKDMCWYNISQNRYRPSGVCKVIQKYYTSKRKVRTAKKDAWRERSMFAQQNRCSCQSC